MNLVSEIAASSIALDQKKLCPIGFAQLHDNGGGTYVRVNAEPAHPGKVRSLDRYKSDGVIDNTNGGWWELVEERVRFTQFGAIGDGITNDNTACANAVSYALLKDAIIEDTDDSRTFLVTEIRLQNGLRKFSVAGRIKGDGTAPAWKRGVVTIMGPTSHGASTPVCVGLEFTGNTIEMSPGEMYGLWGELMSKCVIKDNKIECLENHPTENRYAILLRWPEQCLIARNHCTLASNPTQRHFGIDIIGTGATDGYGGLFANGAGTVQRAQKASKRNKVRGNIIYFGSYAINLLAAEETEVSENFCWGQNHRSIYIADSSWYNRVYDNQLKEYLSSAVVLAYGSCHNEVYDNQIANMHEMFQPGSTGSTGEAAINIMCGSQYNRIEGNRIDAGVNYGIYMAVNVIKNTLNNNRIGGHIISAIALESQIQGPNPSGALYSRPNYAAPSQLPNGTGFRSTWASMHSEGNVISKNIIEQSKVNDVACGIMVSQTGPTFQNRNNIVEENIVIANNLKHEWYWFEETNGLLNSNKIAGNIFSAPTASNMFMTRGRGHCSYSNDNEYIDTANITVADGITVIDVGMGKTFTLAAGSSDITDFINKCPDQDIVVRMTSGRDIAHGTTVRTQLARKIYGMSTNHVVAFRWHGPVTSGAWLESWRNFPNNGLPFLTTVTTDSDVTLVKNSTGEQVRHTATLTNVRKCNLNTSVAVVGDKFNIVRSGAGAFSLDVISGSGAAPIIKQLSQNQWCEVTYDGTAWFVSASGSIA